MDFLQQISTTISREYGQFSKATVFLTETDPGSTTKDTRIKKTGPLFLAKFDKKRQNDVDIFPYFSNEKGVRKISDYLLFYKSNKKFYVFICELKSQRAKGSLKQVEASYVLSQFLVNTVSRMMGFKDIDIEYRALVFSRKGLSKGTCKPKKGNYEIYPSSNLKWVHLKDGGSYHLDMFCD